MVTTRLFRKYNLQCVGVSAPDPPLSLAGDDVRFRSVQQSVSRGRSISRHVHSIGSSRLRHRVRQTPYSLFPGTMAFQGTYRHDNLKITPLTYSKKVSVSHTITTYVYQ
jgi:hypothetical protein